MACVGYHRYVLRVLTPIAIELNINRQPLCYLASEDPTRKLIGGGRMWKPIEASPYQLQF